jgi:hypothetical protein
MPKGYHIELVMHAVWNVLDYSLHNPLDTRFQPGKELVRISSHYEVLPSSNNERGNLWGSSLAAISDSVVGYGVCELVCM